MAKVAFLGLGVMGYPMAGHLKVKGGHDVTVYNRTAAKAEKWVAQYGGKSAPTPKAAAASCSMLFAGSLPVQRMWGVGTPGREPAGSVHLPADKGRNLEVVHVGLGTALGRR